MKKYALIVTLLFTVLAAPAQPAKIILFRHAEKIEEDKNAGLSLKGQERSAALVPFLTQNPGFLGTGSPAILFATRVSKKRTDNHTHETLEPLAARLELKINSPYSNSECKALANYVLTDPSCRGKTVVICWSHTHLPELIAALGVTPAPMSWSKDVFDRTVVISFREGKTLLENLPQRLLYGDSPN
jgi:hypothetical protein